MSFCGGSSWCHLVTSWAFFVFNNKFFLSSLTCDHQKTVPHLFIAPHRRRFHPLLLRLMLSCSAGLLLTHVMNGCKPGRSGLLGGLRLQQRCQETRPEPEPESGDLLELVTDVMSQHQSWLCGFVSNDDTPYQQCYRAALFFLIGN